MLKLYDHSSPEISGEFQQGIHFLGLESSPEFVPEPDGNGCSERAHDTLKDQLLRLNHFETL